MLKTGQTTQYNGKLDDGYYKKGVPKAYTVLASGAQSGNSNIDLVHLTASDISFTAATKTIAQVAAGLAIFKTGDIIVISGSGSNNGVYTIATGNVAAAIVVSEALVDEAAGAAVSIAKRETKSNNCVQDLRTGLMWSRYLSNAGKMGAASDGLMPWTGSPYDIFAYAAAANAAALGGFSDWRIPNMMELASLIDWSTDTADTTIFPNWNIGWIWTSHTHIYDASQAGRIYFTSVNFSIIAKTSTYWTALVRGG